MMYSVMMTDQCNLNCRYCYERNKTNISMSMAVADNLVDWILANDQDTIYIQYHGGEPLLAFETMKYINDKIRQERTVKPRITTNGSLMNKDIAHYLKECDYTVYVSVDGDESVHNENRVDRKGTGSFRKACEAVDILNKNDVNVYVRGTVLPSNVDCYFESVRFLLSNVHHKVGIEPDLFADDWDDSTIASYSDQIIKIIRFVQQNAELNYLVSHTNKWEVHRLGICDGGTSNFFIAQNGDIFPCIYAFLNSDDCIGHISKGIDNGILSSLRDVYALDNPDCRLCIMNSYCVGTRCKYLNKYQTGEYLMPSVQVCRILGASNITVYRHGLA